MTVRLSEFAPNLKTERDLLGFVQQGKLDSDVLEIILPNRRPREYETVLWDYKRKFPNSSGKYVDGADEPNDVEVCELIKDVVSFYNSYGGYILGGIGEFQSDPIIGCQNSEKFAFRLDKFNEKIKSYTKTSINCRLEKFEIQGAEGVVCVPMLFVPKRPPNFPVARFMKGAPEVKRRQVFRKGDIFARIDDRCVAARNDKSVVPFVCSARELDHSGAGATLPAENNLPPRDPNLVKFIGRTEYLDALWWWMVEQSVPLKVLTALGGTGKTSIAYEFCCQIVQNRPSFIEKVVWLSAKKQTYSAIQGKKYATARVDFFDIDTFWRALAIQVGVPDAEISEAEDVQEVSSLVLELIMELPCLIVVDDIDTLDLEQQNELFSQVQMLAGRAFASGSRFLITSRLEFGGMDQKIHVEGFPEPEFNDYVKLLCDETKLQISETLTEKLWKASLGSPIFAASIFRLARLGTSMSVAITSWKGKDGEDVRRFAFAREIEQLSDAECRTLYALIKLGETTQLELTQVLEIDNEELVRHLSRIREYHLFAANDASLRGAKLVVPAPILMMSDIVKAKVTDPKRIERECARARNKIVKDDSSVSFLIGQIIAHWKEDEHDEALEIAEDAVKRNPHSSDLPCMLGRCLLSVEPSRPREADRAFKAAFDNKCTRIELAPLWIEAKNQIGDWVGISDIAEKLPRRDIRGPAALAASLADARLGWQAEERGDPTQAEKRFRKAMFDVQSAIAEHRADDSLAEMREVARESARRYVSLVARRSTRSGDKIDVFNAVKDAFDCHISEASLILTGVTALHEWARDVFSRPYFDAKASDILERRLDDLNEIINHIDDDRYDRRKLVDTLMRIEGRLREDFSAYLTLKN